MTEPREGWAMPANARRFHYYGADSRSLCGRWVILGGQREADTGRDGTEDCAECARRMRKRRASEERAE
jgi:hypothetical protein